MFRRTVAAAAGISRLARAHVGALCNRRRAHAGQRPRAAHAALDLARRRRGARSVARHAPAGPARRLRRLAVFFRVYRLNQPGLWGDDAAQRAARLRHLGRQDPLAVPASSGTRTVPFTRCPDYPIAAAFWLFGPDLTTLRLPGIVLGALCVPLLYATTAPLFGTTVGLLAALFYASSPPQLTHAKQLVQIITGQFFQLAGLCLLVRGLAGRRTWLVIAAALPLGRVHLYVSCGQAGAAGGTRLRGRRPPLHRRAGRHGTPARGRPRRDAGGIHAGPAPRRARVRASVPTRSSSGSTTRRSGSSSPPQHSLWPLWDAVWRTLLLFHYQQGPEYHWFGIGFDPAVNVADRLSARPGTGREPRRAGASRAICCCSPG